MRRNKLLVIGAVIILVIIVGSFYFFGVSKILTPELLKQTVQSWGEVAPLIFIILYALLSVLFIPATPLTLLAGVLFGPIFGTIYTLIGATIGASLAFLVSRFIGNSFLTNKAGPVASRLAAYDAKIKQNGFLTVFILRLIPVFPFNGLNFGLGLTSVTFSSYFFATLFGIIPGTTAFVYFGDSLASLKPINIVIAILIIVAIALIGNYAAKRYSSTS
jgi:uncharacterized membrane protein YdjX (TVP38/TMEM64 family)